jgi:hypothetical protein
LPAGKEKIIKIHILNGEWRSIYFKRLIQVSAGLDLMEVAEKFNLAVREIGRITMHKCLILYLITHTIP